MRGRHFLLEGSSPLSIDPLLVQADAPLGAAIKVLDANGHGLGFAVGGDGRYAGTLAAADVAGRLAAGGSLGDAARSALAPDSAFSAAADLDADTLRTRLNGSGKVLALLDGTGRPVGLASAASARRIPVAEPSLSGNERAYLLDAIDTGWISSQGPYVRRFEEAFAAKIGAAHAVSCSNGTAALHLALLAFGIGPGDEVIVPDLTFAASINVVLHCGATPVLVDVEPDSWNIDPEAAAAAITPRTRAIMPVHLYGQPAAMDAIMALARRHGLVVVEDAAEAAGSVYKGQAAGTIGDAAGFSFFSNKLITTGEGGMIVFRDAAAADRARRLRDHGMNPAKRYWHDEVGYNYRLTNLQAAIGCAQIEQWDTFLAAKLALAGRYIGTLSAVPEITLPAVLPGHENSYWAFSLIVDLPALGIDRDALMARLAKAGIDSRPLFYPLHAMAPYRDHAGNRPMGVTERLSANGLSLPSSVKLSAAEIDFVAATLRRTIEARRLAKAQGVA